jgi:hypothetical protein
VTATSRACREGPGAGRGFSITGRDTAVPEDAQLDLLAGQAELLHVVLAVSRRHRAVWLQAGRVAEQGSVLEAACR